MPLGTGCNPRFLGQLGSSSAIELRRYEWNGRAAQKDMKAPEKIARIFPGFGVATLLIAAALVVLAYTEMHRIKATVTRITADTVPSIYLSGQLQSVTLLRYTLLTDYIDPNNQDEKAALDRQIAG